MTAGVNSGGHLDERLSALLDGELSDDEAVAARAHLAQCAYCTAELAAVDRTRSLLRALPMVDPPVPLTLPAPVARPAPSAVPVAVAAAVAVLLGIQWLPAERSVQPELAGFDQTHASIVEQAPARARAGASAGAAQPVAARTALPGYERVAASRKGQTVHVLYTDGDHALSVFAEPGDLAESSLPSTARRLDVGNQTLWHWQRADGDIVLWQSDGVVYTAVGDAPIAAVMEVAASMPDEDREDSVIDRVRRASRAAAELLSGG